MVSKSAIRVEDRVQYSGLGVDMNIQDLPQDGRPCVNLSFLVSNMKVEDLPPEW